jgi:O-antigen/teichoic acid export membrane protein
MIIHLINFFKNPVVRGSAIYILASGFNALIPFLLIPLLTDYLSTEEFGIVSTFMVLNSIFLLLVGMEQQGFVSVNFFSNEKKIPSILASVLVIGFLSFTMFVFLTACFSNFFESIFEIDSAWILISVAIAWLQFVSQINLTVWQLKSEPIKYGAFQFFNSLFNYGISVALIVLYHQGEEGRIAGISITATLFGLFSFYHLWQSRLITFSVDRSLLKASLLFSLPLIPHGLAGWVNSGLDRILINNFVGIGETGIYSIGYQIGLIIGLVASSFNRAFAPVIFRKLSAGGNDDKKRLIKYTYLYYVVLILMALALYVSSPFLIEQFIDPRYKHSGDFLGWIILGFTADGLYYGVINYIYFSKKTLYVSLITFSSCVLHFVITLTLLPSQGAMAAAYSTAITYIFSFIFAWILSNTIYPMPWFSFRK